MEQNEHSKYEDPKKRAEIEKKREKRKESKEKR